MRAVSISRVNCVSIDRRSLKLQDLFTAYIPLYATMPEILLAVRRYTCIPFPDIMLISEASAFGSTKLKVPFETRSTDSRVYCL